ncbi:4'-phosphopantetheinyl transferase family protein [Devosia submarina]|uniref:4'-phosphopantetheinyl transferase family protein n=1 Tax=Devosia submarina TaxID=1173082 RepID=UPI00147617AB|nr:4'-phosphopantetheinyl transferase superfamily protein [Devosia submarina]
MAEGMVPRGVAVVCRDPDGDVGALFAEERLAIGRAVPRRQAEFAAGRMAAREALGMLGQPPLCIPAGADRAPVWPQGFAGSISHCRGAVVAAAVRGGSHIGIDVEEAVPLEDELWDTVCTPKELEWLKAQGGLWAKVIFSAKEAVYKAQYSIAGRVLEFSEVELTLDQAGCFSARVLVDSALAVEGRFGISDDFVLSFARARRL